VAAREKSISTYPINPHLVKIEQPQIRVYSTKNSCRFSKWKVSSCFIIHLLSTNPEQADPKLTKMSTNWFQKVITIIIIITIMTMTMIKGGTGPGTGTPRL